MLQLYRSPCPIIECLSLKIYSILIESMSISIHSIQSIRLALIDADLSFRIQEQFRLTIWQHQDEQANRTNHGDTLKDHSRRNSRKMATFLRTMIECIILRNTVRPDKWPIWDSALRAKRTLVAEYIQKVRLIVHVILSSHSLVT